MKPLLTGIMFVLLLACNSTDKKEDKNSQPAQVVVKNSLDKVQEDVLVHLDAEKLKKQFPSIMEGAFKLRAGQDVPFQENDLDGDGKTDQIALLTSLAPNEEKKIEFVPLADNEQAPKFKKRTQAEISHKVNGQWKDRKYEGGAFKNVTELHVPPEHTDHSYFIRYEGPGWESDLVGYRFYLDWRNATDIFGKKTTEMVLQKVGQDGFDSYHEPADWGMDILKVGSSLGIGALGTWLDGQAERVAETDSLYSQVVLNGPVESKIRTKYYGWQAGDVKTDVTSELSIHAGSRLTRHDVALSNALPNLCTGIVKHESADFFTHENGEWGYIATWGSQSLAEDHLGMAVIYNKNGLIEITEDEHSHVVVLRPDNNQLTYYFVAAWEQDPEAIQTREAFVKYLEEVVTALGMPPSVDL